MTHHNTDGTLDSVEGKKERVYVFSKALDDRNVPSFCYICGVWFPVQQFFPADEIRLSNQIPSATFTIAVIGINDYNCSYQYLPPTNRNTI
jgi:hypothetical protein